MATAIQLLSAIRSKFCDWARMAFLVLCSLSLNADSKALSCFTKALATAFSVLSARSFDLSSKAVANFEISLIQLSSQSHRLAAFRVGNADAGLGLARHFKTCPLKGRHHFGAVCYLAFFSQRQKPISNLALCFFLVSRQVGGVRKGPLVGGVARVVQVVFGVR